MLDWSFVLPVVLCIIGILFGGFVGFFCGYSCCENQYEEARKLRKQQDVWNEYIELLKGAQNGK